MSHISCEIFIVLRAVAVKVVISKHTKMKRDCRCIQTFLLE